MPAPQQHRLEILAVERGALAAAAARRHGLAAIMALADHLGLRGCGEHAERAIAHHRGQHVGAFIGGDLIERLVDRDEGEIGAGGGLAVGPRDCNCNLGGAARGIARAIGLHLHRQPVPLPADLEPGDAEPVGRLRQIDQRGGGRRRLRLGGNAQPRADVGEPVPPARLHPAAHRQHRDIDIGRIACRQRHRNHRVLARNFGDEARQHALTFDGDECGRAAERHPHLQPRGGAGGISGVFGDQVHPVAIVAAEPPVILAGEPHRSHRARDAPLAVAGGGDRIDLARNTGVDPAAGQPLRIGGGGAARIELLRAHLIFIGVEAADQPPPRGEDFAAVERDVDPLALDRLAVGIECCEAQSQIVMLHQPAIGLGAELDGGRVERDRAGGGEHLAIGVLIVHFDAHVRQPVERGRHVHRLARGAVGAELDRDGLGGGQRGLLVLAVAVHRPHAFGDRPAAEAVVGIIGGGGRVIEPADAQIDRQIGRAAARKIADEQVDRQRAGLDGGGLGAGDGRTHRRQAIFVHPHRLAGVDGAIAGDDRQAVIAERRALGRGPRGLAAAVRADHERQIEHRVRSQMLEPQRALQRRRQREAGGDGGAQQMLHMHRLALADQRAVEHGVERLGGGRIAIGQVEIAR